jgi:hypothetical protein
MLLAWRQGSRLHGHRAALYAPIGGVFTNARYVLLDTRLHRMASFKSKRATSKCEADLS